MRFLQSAVLLLAPVLIAHQEQKEQWQRVYTGEDSTIEIEVTRVTFVEYNVANKVTFASPRVGRVAFRTILSRPEYLKEKPAVKYKTRLETIEFDCAAKRYRLYEARLLDETGKLVKNYAVEPLEVWRVIKFGSMMDKLSAPACKLIEEKRRNP